MRGLAALIGVVALLTVAPVGMMPRAWAGDGTCAVPGQVETDPDGWTAIRAPLFPRGLGPGGSAELSAYAVDPFLPDRLFATNGDVVMRSADGGCRWSQVYPMGDSEGLDVLADVSSSTVIESIVVAGSPDAHDRVYLLMSDRVESGVIRPRVVRSLDGGQSWEAFSTGLLPLPGGRLVKLVVAEQAPDVLYVAATIPDHVAATVPDGDDERRHTVLFVSRDAGTSWHVPYRPGDGGLPPELADLAVAPADAERLWGAGPDGLWRSSTGGSGWENIAQVDTPVTLVDVVGTGEDSTRIWALGSGGSHRSDDGGLTWRPVPVVSAVASVAHGATPDHVLATSSYGSTGAAYGFRAADRRWVLLKHLAGGLLGASADRMAVPSFYAHTPDHIWKYAPSRWSEPGSDLDFEPPSGGVPGPEPGEWQACASDGRFKLQPPPHPVPPELSPGAEVFAVRPGEPRTVTYQLTMPADPTPVDVAFLIDTTTSMDRSICAVKAGVGRIAADLMSSGLDVHFGLAEHRDYATPSPVCNYPYRRIRDIGPYDDRFKHALARMDTFCGGDLDWAEAQLAALYQIATGEGQLPWIPPGYQMNFREDAIRLVVAITDADFRDSAPSPGWTETLAALNDRGIHVAGISAGAHVGYNDLSRVATGTDTVVPEGATMGCDPRGRQSLSPGDPLVCRAGRADGVSQVAEPIIGFVKTLEDLTSVRLVESTTSGLVTGIEPTVYDAVNLRESNLLSFDVTYTCLPEQVGQDYPVRLEAQVAEREVAAVTARVVCTDAHSHSPLPGGPEAPPIEPPDQSSVVPPSLAPLPPTPPPAATPPVAVVAAHAIPGLPPAPVIGLGSAHAVPTQAQAQPQGQPQSQAQLQSGVQAQVQMQAGLAAQEQQQPQTALGQAAQEIREQQGYAMSRQRHHYAVPPVMVLGTGAVLAFGFGVRLALATVHASFARTTCPRLGRCGE